MNRTVFVLGAGASFGDEVLHESRKEWWQAKAPLINWFFAASFLKQYDFLPLEKIESKYLHFVLTVPGYICPEFSPRIARVSDSSARADGGSNRCRAARREAGTTSVSIPITGVPSRARSAVFHAVSTHHKRNSRTARRNHHSLGDGNRCDFERGKM